MPIFAEKEIAKLIANFTGTPLSLVARESYQSNGLATQIDGDMQLYSADGLKIICKIQSKNFYEKLGRRIDSDCNKGILGLWIDAPHRMKAHHKKEAHIYERINPDLKKYLPTFYGSYYDENRSVILLEYIAEKSKVNTVDSITEIDFLIALHNFYYEDEFMCKKIGTYIPAIEDYLDSKKIYSKLVDYIQEYYIGLYDGYLLDARVFINDIEDVYSYIVSCGRTLCHGDYAYVNRIRTKEGNLKVYDWETSCYINPEYDVITYLVRSAYKIDDEYIANIIDEYFLKSVHRHNKDDFKKCLMINLHIQFFYGYAWILPMFVDIEKKEVGSFKLWFEMNNFISLYNFLKDNKLQ